MESNIEEMKKRLQTAETFIAKYPDAPGYLDIIEAKLNIDKSQVVKAGEIFGQEGWKRKVCWNETTFDWVMVLGEITIIIDNVEVNEFDGTSVAKETFPIQLEN